MSLGRWVAPVGSGAAAFETLLLPLLAIGAGMWLNPLDPLWTQASFPWAWLAPVLLALRYGAVSGLVAALLLVAAWFGLARTGFGSGAFPQLYFLGGLITVMLCGEFASIWRARLRRAEAMQVYLDQRLDYLTQQHYLLRLSHDRLEQDLISRPLSMRDALTGLRALGSGQPGALPGAQPLLRLLAQYCQLEQAALFAMHDEAPGAEAARIGPHFELQARDPLLRYALAERRLAHVREAGAESSAYVVVAPLMSTAERVHGVLAVARLPFFALHEETLQTLNLLLGYYADGLDARAIAAPLQRAQPHCPLDFAFELERLWRIRHDSGVRSAIVALGFAPRPGARELAQALRGQQRALDVTWLIESGDQRLLLTLLPLAAQAAAEGYLRRIEAWLRAQRGTDLTGAGIAAQVFVTDSAPPAALLTEIFASTGVAPPADAAP